MKYKIVLTKSASDSIKKLHKAYKRKLKVIIERLGENPFSYPYRKIRGYSNIFRIRVGKYRLLYEVRKKNNIIIILKVEKRETVYDKI